MKAVIQMCLTIVFAFGFFAVSLSGQEGGAAAGPNQYIGTKKCKMCHNSEAQGKQFPIWETSAHAKAYQVLGTEEAKPIAAKAGVQGNPQESDQCLKCHVTAFGVDAALIQASFVREEGIQCEACHGPGSNYYKKSVMENKELAVKSGLIIPDETTCKQCHNEKSPTFKGFDYKVYFAKIAHPVPQKTQ